MGKTALFLLFPMYQEAGGDKSYYLKRFDLKDEDVLNNYIHKVEEINTFFDYENYEGYYDSQNVSHFSYPLDEVEDCYPGKKTYLRTVLKHWEDWRDTVSQAETDVYRAFKQSIADDTLCEIAKKISESTEITYLLINHSAFDCYTPKVVVNYNGVDISIFVCSTDSKEIAAWFELNRKPQRVYHHNPKHGENGRGAHPSNKKEIVSRLLCSNQEAEVFLKKAIGVCAKPTMHYYDEQNKQYIEFKRERENVYHAFHIGADGEGRVPKLVQEKIKLIQL